MMIITFSRKPLGLSIHGFMDILYILYFALTRHCATSQICCLHRQMSAGRKICCWGIRSIALPLPSPCPSQLHLDFTPASLGLNPRSALFVLELVPDLKNAAKYLSLFPQCLHILSRVTVVERSKGWDWNF